MVAIVWFFFFQAEDGIRDLVRSRGLGDVYKRQILISHQFRQAAGERQEVVVLGDEIGFAIQFDDGAQLGIRRQICLLYTSDAADERSSVDLGGRRIIKKKKKTAHTGRSLCEYKKYIRTKYKHGNYENR